jgi:hypothetical protein
MTANDIIAAILRSPLHGVLSGSTMLITVTGRKTGRAITLPVNYAQSGKRVLVTSLAKRTWWRNLIGGAPVTVLLQGKTRRGTGCAITGIDAAVGQELKAFLAMRPDWAKQFGVRKHPDGTFDADDLTRTTHERVVVDIELEDMP